MSKLLFKLHHVPEDEADAVRALLKAEAIRYYETQPGPFGLSSGGIWLVDIDDLPRAQELLNEYQRKRRDDARAAHARAIAEGTAETFSDLFRQRPLFVIAMLLGMAAALVLVLIPFFLLL